jgi:hypothetical protein
LKVDIPLIGNIPLIPNNYTETLKEIRRIKEIMK